MNCATPRLTLRHAALLAMLVSPAGVGAQSRAFIGRLGTDTIAVERFTRTGNRIAGTLLRRTPVTNMLTYSMSLNRDGSVATYEQTLVRADGSPVPNVPTGQRMRFEGDSISRVQTLANGESFSRRNAAPRGTFPAVGGSWLLLEMEANSARKGGAGSYRSFGFAPQQDTASRTEVRFVGADSAEIIDQGFRFGLKFNRAGHLSRGDGSLTTQKFVVTPVRDADVKAIATAWAAKDAAGRAVGVLSPRDTLSAEIGGAKVFVEYGRPAKRGREIWGKLVPFDTTWRMGANAAAQFRTDKDLDMGGTAVPAGAYTIWLLPSAGTSYLLVNKQTVDGRGRPLWGTMWDPKQDLVRVPLEKHMAMSTSEERFRIFVQGDHLMFHWDNGGYGVRVKAQ